MPPAIAALTNNSREITVSKVPSNKKHNIRMMIPDNINKIPQNHWLFFQTTTFFMLHGVRRPIMEFRFSYGMIFPRMMRAIPRIPNEIFVRENGTSFRFST